MQAVHVLFWNTDDSYPRLHSFYEKQVMDGCMQIAGYRIHNGHGYSICEDSQGQHPLQEVSCDKVIISSDNHYYAHYKDLLAQGIPSGAVVDGRVFQIHGLDSAKLFLEGKACGRIARGTVSDASCTVYPRMYRGNGKELALGTKSYVSYAVIEGNGQVNIGNYTSISWDIVFELGLNEDHDAACFSTYGMTHLDWPVDKAALRYMRPCKIEIGSDVWIGRGCRLKSSNPEQPLIIGDGAVIAADSVIVKSVPPYAIVGGNPAQMIRYRFSEEKIDALKKLQWWNLPMDEIHDICDSYFAGNLL